MSIEIKKSIKPVNYSKAIKFLEKRLDQISKNKAKELIWILEHPSTYTSGNVLDKKDILDNSIKIIKTSRGGKITWHGPGQIVCYLVINLNNRKKNIRNFLNIIESSIINTLKEFGINSYADRKNIGIWVNTKSGEKKIAAIGIKIKKWITFHGFSININNDLNYYKKIIPCGIKNKGITNLNEIKKQNYKRIKNIIIKNLILNFKI
tara:strand:- start:208 stop:828 length:621 start_codon:yes stop_codon:yes gene_type:complete